MCYFSCVEGFTFRNIIVGGLIWSNMERPLCNCVPCHFPNVNCQIDPSLILVFAYLQCMSCGQFSRISTMLIYDQCSRGRHMGCLTPPLGRNANQQNVLPPVQQVDLGSQGWIVKLTLSFISW